MKQFSIFLILILSGIVCLAQYPIDSVHAAIDKALWVVDGTLSGRGFVEKLNPDQIESISILKGKEATDVYGNKARYGAILITTRTVARKNFWTTLCAASEAYREIIQSPEEDSLVTYQFNGGILPKGSENKIYHLKEKNIKAITVSVDKSFSGSSDRTKHYIVAIETIVPEN